jgi:hypothetical protein
VADEVDVHNISLRLGLWSHPPPRPGECLCQLLYQRPSRWSARPSTPAPLRFRQCQPSPEAGFAPPTLAAFDASTTPAAPRGFQVPRAPARPPVRATCAGSWPEPTGPTSLPLHPCPWPVRPRPQATKSPARSASSPPGRTRPATARLPRLFCHGATDAKQTCGAA